MESATAAVRSALGFRETMSTDVDHGPSPSSENAMSAHGNINERVYNPSVQDILEVKGIVQQASKMPLELIDAVIDFAEYWACSSIETLSPKVANGISSNLDHRQSKGSNILVVSTL